ncbi:MAG: iron-containing alcohol dehydrogenase, partial [Spartobacteria bacterium]|nr:iron-containing alcohol dehydrogenase [Spartobacteria bacterium]
MNSFNQYQPTHLIFGAGRLKEVGRVAKQYGNKAMLVADPNVKNFLSGAIITAIESLRGVGIDVVEFNKVHPNPRLIDVQEGASIARSEGVDLMIAMGGGSSCDTARAIAVASTHEGTAMDYLYFCEKQPTDKTLPMIMIPTTSGTGSHMSCCAVITDETKNFKSALWNRDQLFARTAIVDPELMCTVPKSVTASTGFDVFTHLFESYININHTPYIDLLALEGIRILAAALPKLIDDLGNVELRSQMAWADTLAGTSIANVGTTLPHGMGQPISGHCPHV